MKTTWMAMTVAVGALAFSGAALAADAKAGEAKADACLNCHEPAEDFAGQTAATIEAKIKSWVSGKTKHAKKFALSDADIADIAAYFASAK